MKINQLKAGVILSYVSMAVSMVINVIYTPVMLRYLGQSEYGLYTLVASVVNYLSLCSLGFGASYLRFYSITKSHNNKEEEARLNGMYLFLFSIFALVSFALGMLLVANCETVLGSNLTSNEMGTARILMFILVINLVMTFPATVFNSIISAHECFLFQRIASLISIIANPLIVFPLLIMGYRSIAMVMVTTAITFFSLIINIWYCVKKIKVKFLFSKFNFKLLKDMGAFSFFIFLNTIIDQINWSVDKFLLGRFIGTAGVAVYGVASQLNNIYMNFANVISTVFFPRVNRIVAENNDDKELTTLFIKIGRIQFMVLGLIASGLIIFGEYFISVWAGKGYEESYRVALILILPVTVPLIQSLGIEIQRAKNKHRFRSIIYIFISVLNIGISIPLCKALGATGAAIGTSTALIIGNCIIMNIFYHKVIKIDIIKFWKNIIKFIPSLVLPALFGSYVMLVVKVDSIVKFIVCGILYVCCYCASVYFHGMDENERNMIRKPIKKIISMIKN